MELCVSQEVAFGGKLLPALLALKFLHTRVTQTVSDDVALSSEASATLFTLKAPDDGMELCMLHEAVFTVKLPPTLFTLVGLDTAMYSIIVLLQLCSR